MSGNSYSLLTYTHSNSLDCRWTSGTLELLVLCIWAGRQQPLLGRVNPLPYIYGCQYPSRLPLSHQNVLIKLASLGGQSSVLSVVEFFQHKVFEMAYLRQVRSAYCIPCPIKSTFSAFTL